MLRRQRFCRVQTMSIQAMICFALRASWRRAPLCLVNLRVARCAGFWSSEASPCRRTRKRDCSPFRRQRTPNLAAVPCRQRPKRAPERERERDSSSCSNGSSWAARAVLMRLTRAPRPSGQVGARVSDLLARPLGPPRVNEGSGVIGHLVVAAEPSALLASRGQWGHVRPPARSVAAAAAVGLKGACPATFPFNNGERTCPATLRSTTASLLSIRGAHRHSTPASGHVGPFFRSTIAGGDVLPPPPHRSRGA